MIEHRHNEHRLHRTSPGVVRKFVARLEFVERNRGSLRGDGTENSIADDKRSFDDVRIFGREFTHAQVRAGIVLPKKHGGVQVHRLSQQTQREQDGLMNFFHA